MDSDPEIHIADHPGDAFPRRRDRRVQRGLACIGHPGAGTPLSPAAGRDHREHRLVDPHRGYSRLSDREVERLLANREIRSFGSRDEQEVAGYAEVMETVVASWAEISVSENHIKQLHRELRRHRDKDERHRGEHKTAPNSVAAFNADGHQVGVVFATASPFDTPRLMGELVVWFG